LTFVFVGGTSIEIQFLRPGVDGLRATDSTNSVHVFSWITPQGRLRRTMNQLSVLEDTEVKALEETEPDKENGDDDLISSNRHRTRLWVAIVMMASL